MTARDTRTGGKHEARERGAYETLRDDVQRAETVQDSSRQWFGYATWKPFAEFFEKLQRQTA